MKRSIAVAGMGYWGKNLVRVFNELGALHTVCDLDSSREAAVSQKYPQAHFRNSIEDALADEEIQGVAIATPASTHADLVRQSLEAGKHVFVEKPLALSVQEGEGLVSLADRKRRILMVGHLLIYHPAVRYLKRLIDDGACGEIYYVISQRTNLGKIRSDENVLWSLAPHDISVVLHLLGCSPDVVIAHGGCFIQKDAQIEDVVFLHLGFPTGQRANIHVSWLDPDKTRRLTVVGSKRMVVFDDMSASEKVRIHDKGIDNVWEPGKYNSYGDALTLRTGDIHVPRVDMREPLSEECSHFLECIDHGRVPATDGKNGLDILRVLAAAQSTLR